ncbi:aqualysin-1-like isoform X1 [Anneissia japonica]|uniref:aqualysin-1-like isoform X1 n=1 Tax=Anneissia japonica TaxID=1529436 RepID=UPI0014259303|nr:aqualysin-1-like isoform X1 [Anneissia japonica]
MKVFLFLIGTAYVLLLARPNDACSRTPECTSIHDDGGTYDELSSAGKATLYNNKLDGNNYIVVLKDDQDTEAMRTKIDSVRSFGKGRIAQSKAINGPLNGIKAVVSDLDKEELDQILEMKGVKYVEKNAICEPSAYTDVWGLDRIDQRNLPLDSEYSSTGKGSGVIVYVVDSGVNTRHSNFDGRAENWHEVVSDIGQDCMGHGTHVAGTIAARTYGVAQGVYIRSVRVFGCPDKNSTAGDLVEAINYILDYGYGGSVVSMSLGYNTSCKVIDDAVKKLILNGFVVVVAAGNSNIDACTRSPSRVTEAITVGATDINDKRASFSNYGSGVDIFAPGVDIISLDNATNTETTIKSGTSMATPHVSGVAAILRSRGVPASEIRQKIFDLSTKDVVKDPKGSHNRLLFID